MANACIITRKSIFTFLKNYQYFTATPSFFAFPYAATYLLAPSLASSSQIFSLIEDRLRSLFYTARFLPWSQLFATFNLMLSQTLFPLILASPFLFLALPLVRAAVIKAFDHQRLANSSLMSLFYPLLATELCNKFILLSANATCFFVLAAFFNLFYVLGLPSHKGLALLWAVGFLSYSVTFGIPCVICSLASVSCGMEKKGGFISIVEAFIMIRGRIGTALLLAVVSNLPLALFDALFKYRVIRVYDGESGEISVSLVMEGILIVYLYGVFIVFDMIVGCVFWRWCKGDGTN